ncbi:hypothetical protein TSOC_006798, partial [Tetrabaena socialis]
MHARYCRFLALHAQHPEAALVPAADIALLWHTHLCLSGPYAAMCQQLFGTSPRGSEEGGPGSQEAGGQPAAGAWAAAAAMAAAGWRPEYLEMDPLQLAAAYGETGRLYELEYGEPYDGPDTAWVPASTPYPLAAPRSPLLGVLRLFDEVPSKLEDGDRKKAAAAARSRGAGRLSFAPGAVPRCGAHSLFAAWTAGLAAAAELERAPVCCWGAAEQRDSRFI